MPGQVVRCLYRISGTVQGVGFRPFVYNLAMASHLMGCVYNDSAGVVIEVEGEAQVVAGFARELVARPPDLARIDQVYREEIPLKGCRVFVIGASRGRAAGQVLLPPDLATCPECRREVADPDDRHYRYPFTNCTNCGPRFTIVNELPYDRRQTVMHDFAMCVDCAREYHDPANRRFHAQPVACPACGPGAELVDRWGHAVSGDWLQMAGKLLRAGYILAVKGLGGFHLACDAANWDAVAELRRRKHRPSKPLAIMCRDVETVTEHCYLAREEAGYLQSPVAPIVLLQRRADCHLAPQLAPGLDTLGTMLPYTPLHLLLMQEGPPVLAMTSGNRSKMPLVTDNRQALEELGDLADYFIWHNRTILNRCDDSVLAVVGGQVQLLRRSRGYVPQPLDVPVKPDVPPVLAVGGAMKNTFCLISAGKAYLSQHIGEVETLEGQQNLIQSINNFCRLTGITPGVVTCDLHPGYGSTRVAGELVARWGARWHPGVQHHHAHLASCLAENRYPGEVIGIILDGTGFGLDGHLWGFEVMRGDYRNYCREFYLAYVPLPGGERAIRYPWLTATAYLITCLGEKGQSAAGRIFLDRQQELAVAEKMIRAGFNTPLSSSCGRLFDTIAALLNLCCENTYEGQAAVTLGSQAPWFPSSAPGSGFPIKLNPYGFTFEGVVINPARMLSRILEDVDGGLPAPAIAKRFHDTVIAMVAGAANKIREKTGLSTVALSGGAWHNRYLSGVAGQILQEQGFTVLQHHLVPPGDGGLSLGQAMITALALT